jgi:S-adenosylmethionine:tRNA ribosyltransferase-isomerase
MNLSNFDYDLPEDRIAKQPPKIRGSSKLLVLNRDNGAIKDKIYSQIVDYFDEGDIIVLNDSKVIKARIFAKNKDNVLRELVILEKHGKTDDWHRHKVLYRKKLKINETLFIDDKNIIVEKILGGGIAIIKSDVDLIKLCEKYGKVPLPPYIHRDATSEDEKRYQTVFAKEKGSVAAPTASLNITKEMLKNLETKGVKICYLTLHVGLGTFMPIRADDLNKYKMHKEYYEISRQTIQNIKHAKQNNYNVVALGTTVTRALECCALEILSSTNTDISGEADIFIFPGYKFKIVDKLITNFHAPRSTVLMMAAAFAGWQNLKPAYLHAIENNYKLLSYGDSMFIL